MKLMITKLKCIAAAAVATTLFGLSMERGEAASIATMVYTVEGGRVTHIDITAPFSFYSQTGGIYPSILLLVSDLYPGGTTTTQQAFAPSDVLFSVSGTGKSYSSPAALTGVFDPNADGDFGLGFGFPSGINLTSEDYVTVSGGFDVSEATNMLAPTEGSYSAIIYGSSGMSVTTLTNSVPVDVIVNTVPEAGSCVLGLMGFSLMIARRKR